MAQRRNTELFLLVAVTPVVVLLFALSYAATRAELELTALAVPAVLLAAFFGAHVAARRLAPDADPVLLPVAAFLSSIGVAFVSRLDPDLGASQLLWVLVGLVVLIGTLAAVQSLERLGRYKYTIMLVGIVLLVLPALVGVEVNGARLWLRFAGLSFQPAEVAKILIVVFLGSYLAENREVLTVSTTKVLGISLPSARHLGPLVFMWAVSLFVLIAEKDLGSSLLFFGIFLVMVFVATGRASYIVVGLGLFAAGAAFAYSSFGHVQQRIGAWLDPFADPQGQGYQLVQSLFALAAGGLVGLGIGRGFPGRIPFVETDFVFSAISEEIGLLGGAAVIIAYLVFCMRGLATAARARSDTAALVSTGLVAAIGLQAFVIIGGVTLLIPLTGLTLPFVSYGGSSVVANFALLALLMRAGDAGGRPPAGEPGPLGRGALVRRLWIVAVFIAALMVTLMVNLTYRQVVQASALRDHPDNTRGLAEEIRQERGAILTADGAVLAESVPDGDVFRREYPAGDDAAHVVGYYSTQYGRAGVEAAMNETLTGRREHADLRDLVDAAAGVPVVGDDVWLTIDSRVQTSAEAALEGKVGSVVVLDPRSGEVLAMASSPSYAPAEVDEEWQELSSAAGAPLVHRATGALYPPGSSFKPVTLTGGLADGAFAQDSVYSGASPMDIGNAPVTNYGGNSYGDVSVREATVRSINTAYGQMAVDLGASPLVGQARGFGFDSIPPIEIPAEASVMSQPDLMTEWELAWAGIGQPVGEHEGPIGPSATPLQMALVAAGIANDGVVMEPHLVGRVTDFGGKTLRTVEPAPWTEATGPATADEVTDIMVEVVESGTGRAAQLPDATVAGKTGTAEIGDDLPTHAWFIAFAPAEAPRVAIAVLVEQGGTGGAIAAPLARDVLQTALEFTR